MEIDLNADLGEGSGADAELMPLITSVNICGGLHAGGPLEIAAALALAQRYGVSIGAHPGYADRENFGRKDLNLRNQEIVALTVYQIGALSSMAASIRTNIRYIKPHGALYTQACKDQRIASLMVATAMDFELALVGLPGSRLEELASGRVPFIAEGFADRRYRPDGSLVPRTDRDAFVHDPDEAMKQVEWLINERGVRTICVHGDNPEAVVFAKVIRDSLIANGVTLKAFA
jgi:5-oxoprolinase (ATP-hydrolysing) subunit A